MSLFPGPHISTASTGLSHSLKEALVEEIDHKTASGCVNPSVLPSDKNHVLVSYTE